MFYVVLCCVVRICSGKFAVASSFFFFAVQIVSVCFDLFYDVSVCFLLCFRWFLVYNVLLSNDVLDFVLMLSLFSVVLGCLGKMFDCSRLLLS